MKKLICIIYSLCFWCYMAMLLYFLFFSEKYGRTVQYQDYQYNLQLFHEIERYFKYWEIVGIESFLINVVGNVAAFVPFGFFVPILLREQRKDKTIEGHYILYFFIVTFLGALFSLAVEIVQLVTKVGCFDVDDLLLNTIGVVFGYIFYAVIRCITKKNSEK